MAIWLKKRHWVVLGALGILPLLACQEEVVAVLEGDLIPVEAVTVEVRLPFDEFARDLEAWGGYGRPYELTNEVLANTFDGSLNARVLLDWFPFPRSAQVRDTAGLVRTDTILTFIGGRLVARFDTLASVFEESLEVGVGALSQEWDFVTANWDMAVDSVGDRRAWSERLGRSPSAPGEPSGAGRPVPVGGGGGLAGLGRDLRHAVRSLRRRPGFTSAVILCLGVGLGANTAVFSFVYGILLRPLPFQEPDRLAILYERKPGLATRASPIYSNYVAWREESRAFSQIGAYSRTTKILTGEEGPELLEGCAASHNLFDVLGVQPVRGREFQEDDDIPGAPATVILSNGLWQQRFGARPEVLGSTLALDGEPHTIVGVMPEGFRYPENARYWVPSGRAR